ncbi:MAG: hypothetical protein IPO06_25635 [Leptospiraceae bacterium]|nr:hypothetical protein [Leptospiraceae bacterium]
MKIPIILEDTGYGTCATQARSVKDLKYVVSYHLDKRRFSFLIQMKKKLTKRIPQSGFNESFVFKN